MNNQVKEALPFENTKDFDDARKGFIGTWDHVKVDTEDGHAVWDLEDYNFIEGEAPDSVNPSLWRIAQLNMTNGLFKVTDRVYQVRGFDMSNTTIMEGDTGLVITDTLMSVETARAALDLYYEHRPKKPIKAIIYTHSHADHYGGVAGLITKEDVASGKVALIGPEGFMEAAVSENIFAGNAMIRRAEYMYGSRLSRGKLGQVDAGLGKTASKGHMSLLAPNDTITFDHEKRVVDGIEVEFLMAPNTEAPSEHMMYFPQFKLLNIAEDAVHNLHNILTLRGAQIRDAYEWWKDIDKAIRAFGDQSESGPWRNVFLAGADELRNSVPEEVISGVTLDIVEGMPFNLILDYMGIRLNGERSIDKRISMNWKLTDVDENYHLLVNNSVLIYRDSEADDKADLTLTTTRDTFNHIFGGVKSFEEAFADQTVKLEGDAKKFAEFASLLDEFNPVFNIVTP